MKKNFCLLALLFWGIVLFPSCSDDDDKYILDGLPQNADLIKKSTYRTNTDKSLHFTYDADPERAKVIYDFFRLDTLYSKDLSTWENVLRLAHFVSDNIPHKNQQNEIDDWNAIDIWKFVKNIENGVNCRLHSILLSELMFAVGIENRYITCRPEDADDQDCHVVNIAWIPEMDKWVMIDSDMKAYVSDSDGVPLSLQEMREYYRNGADFEIHFFSADNCSEKYYRAYWAKNLYWFCSHEKNDFNLESKNAAEGDRYILLIPDGWDCYDVRNKYYVVTYDDQAFWAKPGE